MNGTPQTTRPLGDLLRIFTAPAIWLAHFSVLYAAEALICTAPSPSAGQTMTGIAAAATAAALIGLTVLVVRTARGHAPADFGSRVAFRPAVTAMLAGLSILGVIWTAFPVAVLPACSGAGAA